MQSQMRRHQCSARNTRLMLRNLTILNASSPTVAMVIASLGLHDPATFFLPTRYIARAEKFVADVRSASASNLVPGPEAATSPGPLWPKELNGMCAARQLYDSEVDTSLFVAAFVELVIHKVKRIDAYYKRTGETKTDNAPPSQATVDRLRDPTACGGAYFINDGIPWAKFHESAQDDNSDEDVTSCWKQVR